jgi:hypothetical protein
MIAKRQFKLAILVVAVLTFVCLGVFTSGKLTYENAFGDASSASKVVELPTIEHPNNTETVFTSKECKSTCCVEKVALEPWYPTGRSKPAFYDLSSPMAFRHLAEIAYGDMPKPETVYAWRPELIACLQPYTVVWVDHYCFNDFLLQELPKITVPIVLVTGDGDWSVDPHHIKAINNTAIVRWFGMNCNIPESDIFTCLPLGISQW